MSSCAASQSIKSNVPSSPTSVFLSSASRCPGTVGPARARIRLSRLHTCSMSGADRPMWERLLPAESNGKEGKGLQAEKGMPQVAVL